MSFFDLIKKTNKYRKNIRTKNKELQKRKLITESIKSNSVAQNYSTFYDTKNYLSSLCELHGTDKGYLKFEKATPYGWKPHTYSIFYHSLFSHCRDSIKLLFECGIGTNNINVESNMSSNGKPGASLKVWKDYFTKAQIIGGDIDERILFEDERIKTFQVNQLDPTSIKEMWAKINKENFDIIIDDGLHTYEAGITLFLNSFHKLKKGGIYIIEDVDFKYLNELKNGLKKFNTEIVVLTNDYFDQNSINDANLNDNNLILVRKD
tara:strand:+ start:220 stop:1011 length:792 start_codon:yes stop_codon:yes gene_type:complete